jgi:hypothetical protein
VPQGLGFTVDDYARRLTMFQDFNAAVQGGTTYPVCEKCGGTVFEIQGFVGYTQSYDAQIGEYCDYDIDGNCDFPTHASCPQCQADVTNLLREHNLLTFYKVVPE